MIGSNEFCSKQLYMGGGVQRNDAGMIDTVIDFGGFPIPVTLPAYNFSEGQAINDQVSCGEIMGNAAYMPSDRGALTTGLRFSTTPSMSAPACATARAGASTSTARATATWRRPAGRNTSLRPVCQLLGDPAAEHRPVAGKRHRRGLLRGHGRCQQPVPGPWPDPLRHARVPFLIHQVRPLSGNTKALNAFALNCNAMRKCNVSVRYLLGFLRQLHR
jgi:hypothetical protein